MQATPNTQNDPAAHDSGCIGEQRLADLLEGLAAKTPAPGGGAAAGILGATAASLAGMVVSFSLGKKSLAEHQPALEAAADRLVAIRAAFLALADEDAAAYAALNALQRLPEDAPERVEGEPAALRRAIEAPENARTLAMELLGLTESLVGRSNKWLASDLAIAAVSAEAAANAAGWNVRINAPGLPAEDRDRFLARVQAGDAEASETRVRVEAACRGD